MITKFRCQTMDAALYAMMNWIHWRLRHDTTTKEMLEAYLDECAPLNREHYFAAEPMKEVTLQADKISWKSPQQHLHPENNEAHTLFFRAKSGNPSAPTLIILHALMSVNNKGYCETAKKMNEKGWNVLLPHLPFHYSRCPKNYSSGSLAITADLVRNGETLRQAVNEVRQLMHWSKAQGSSKIGLLATSYGGWIASLVMSLEPVDFALLLQPIVEINHATFQSPLSRIMAYLLASRGITSEHIARHAHLTAPKHGIPQCRPERLIIIGGTYDKISPPHYLRDCCKKWNGAIYQEVAQGHFGFRAMKLALQLMDKLVL